MKYITTTDDKGNIEIFVFSKAINHDCMAEVIFRIRDKSHGNWERITRTPLSAGFVTDGKCHGYSETLKLESRPEDTELLKAT